MKEQMKKVRHDLIRYANCWEDADILLEALDIQKEDRVLSIGSAGDNCFSILSKSPAIVVAVDVNMVQLQLIELKKAAFKALDHDSLKAFLGFEKSDDRWLHFDKVKIYLNEDQVKFWTERKQEIEDGIIDQGKFEKYFGSFRKKILPLIHSRKTVEELFEKKSDEEQATFFQERWNTWRWRLLFKLFFSRFVLGRFGRDPKFLKEVKMSVSSYVMGRAADRLKSIKSQDNYFLKYILKGEFGEYLPHYMRKENFEIIKKNIDGLVCLKGLAEDAFNAHADLNKFNLSNIFEYMDKELFHSVSDNLIQNASSNAIFVYWNLMVPRRMSVNAGPLKQSEAKSLELSKKDKGFFYSNFIIDLKK